MMEAKTNRYAKRSATGLNSLASQASPLIKKMLKKNGITAVELFGAWEQIVGEEVAKFTIVQKLDFGRGKKDNGCLYVIVPSGAYALELQYKEPFIIERINTYMGYLAVGSIRIIQDASFEKKVANKNNLPIIKKNVVSVEEENYINSITENVANNRLKNILISIGKAVFSHDKEE